MHQTVKNLISIKKELELISNKIPSIIAVSKTFPMSNILPLIEHGHIDFGENKVQEALEKWNEIKEKFSQVKLHMVGKLQSNKVKFVLPLFDFIHSLDNEKLAQKIADEQKKYKKKPKIFIQVNLGAEDQKSGILINDLIEFYNYSKNLNLNVIGLMCIPPFDEDSTKFFLQMSELNEKINLKELSMGMSSDYMKAVEYKSTFLRIGSNIFGQRG